MAIKTSDYETLTAQERFQLLVEAMARKDEVECKRLEDSCPTHTYRCEDVEFRDRVRRAFQVTSIVCLNMRAGIARIRMAQMFKETSPHFAQPVAKLATAAYLCGRAQGRAEAGGDPGPGPADAKAMVAMVKSDARLRGELGEIRSLAEETLWKVADWLSYAVGQADAADLLAQWEGFGRFCRNCLGLEPLVVTEAFGLGKVDVEAEMMETVPDAAPDEAESARWAEQWCRGWERRFGDA